MASNSKSKKSGSSTAATVFKVIGLCLLVIVLLAIIFFIIYFASNGFGGSMATFICKVNGKTILSDRSVSLPSGSMVKVYSFSDYTISISAVENDDFAFTVDGEEYSWSVYAGEDMTAGFTFEETDDGIVITYGTPEEILSAVFGADVTVEAEEIGEIFELVVESGSSSLHLPFSPEYDYLITVEPDRIVFSGGVQP